MILRLVFKQYTLITQRISVGHEIPLICIIPFSAVDENGMDREAAAILHRFPLKVRIGGQIEFHI